MNVREILTAHLKSIGADGLCTEACRCSIDDLMPCADWSGGITCKNCLPAKRIIAQESGEFNDVGDTIFV